MKVGKFRISKKLTMAIVTGLLVVLNDGLDLNIDSDSIMYIVGLAISYIGGQSIVDRKLAEKK